MFLFFDFLDLRGYHSFYDQAIVLAIFSSQNARVRWNA